MVLLFVLILSVLLLFHAIFPFFNGVALPENGLKNAVFVFINTNAAPILIIFDLFNVITSDFI